jgi:hypothetical protein
MRTKKHNDNLGGVMGIRDDEIRTPDGFITPRYYALLYDHCRPWRGDGVTTIAGQPIERLAYPTVEIASGWRNGIATIPVDDETAFAWATELMRRYAITPDAAAVPVNIDSATLRVDSNAVNYEHITTRWVGTRLWRETNGSYTGVVVYGYMSPEERAARDAGREI